jgi:integrase
MAQFDLFRQSKRPWNTGRIIGAKPPLKPKHIWGIRQQLKTANRIRDLALFNCAIDAKLRGCDLVKLRVSDVAPGGSLRQRATVIQQKTGRPVPFEITDPAREALSAWLAFRGQRTDNSLFPSRSRSGNHLSTRQYARLVGQWIGMIGLEPSWYAQSAPSEGGAGLQEDRQSSRLPTAARPPQAGEHCPLPRH